MKRCCNMWYARLMCACSLDSRRENKSASIGLGAWEGVQVPQIPASAARIIWMPRVIATVMAIAHPSSAEPTAVARPAQFGTSCSVCHGGEGEGTDRAPSLMSNRELRGQSEADIAQIIKGGRGNMPSFVFLPAQEIQSLAHFVRLLNADAFDAQPSGDVNSGRLSSRAQGAARRVTRFRVWVAQRSRPLRHGTSVDAARTHRGHSTSCDTDNPRIRSCGR